MSRLPAVCFVSPHALPALLDGSDGGLGGAEMQQALLGRELARRGHRVTFIVGDEGPDGGPIPRVVNGMTVIATPWGSGPVAGGPAESPLGRSWRLACETGFLWRAMDRARADVCTVRSNHLAAVMAAGWCRMWGLPFVFASGHDGNCDLEMAHRRPRRAVEITYAAALRGAAAVVAQSETQRAMMRLNFGVLAEVIPSGVRVDRPVPAGERGGVLWVGTIEARKGPDRLLEVARALPGIDFTMVGGPGGDAALLDEIRSESKRLPNVVWRGPLSHEETMSLFCRSAIYLNTSRSEGFPNTFLDAWLTGTPLVSMRTDPDGAGCLERRGVGLVTGCTSKTCRAILDLLGDPRRRDAMGRAGRHHLESRHALPIVAPRWQDLLERVVARPADATMASVARGAA